MVIFLSPLEAWDKCLNKQINRKQGLSFSSTLFCLYLPPPSSPPHLLIDTVILRTKQRFARPATLTHSFPSLTSICWLAERRKTMDPWETMEDDGESEAISIREWGPETLTS